MFHRFSERSIIRVRYVLVAAWLLLIVSLFYDPITPYFTAPADSPLRAGGPVLVQGKPLSGLEQPYALGTTLFWGIGLALLPLFLVVFGHEAWRRICPLSALMQIPRRLGIQFHQDVFNRKTGLAESRLNLIRPESWLARNSSLLPFSLLCLGAILRILLINSHRTALGIFFLAVIVIAIAVGYFFGGKTWCNYICPLSPVQKIYTGPGGLLESDAYKSPTSITKSMCRTTKPDKSEVSACVGCVRNCPDIDLEKNYWEELSNPARRFVHYGYFGLVVGFYTYYRLYSGSWEYYYSGAWTHSVSARLGDPGFFWNGHAVAIPRGIAAPLYVLACIFSAYLLWCGVEWLWRKLSAPAAPDDMAVRHRVFSIATYLTINFFYLFSGKPILRRLPDDFEDLAQMAVATASTIWLLKSLERSRAQFNRESLMKFLLRQLKTLALDFSKLLDGRVLEDLKPGEVYVLAKVLPGVSKDDKLGVYKGILREALATAKTHSSESLGVLRDVRQQLGVTDSQHSEILLELGVENPALLDPDYRMSQEHYVRLSGYRESVMALLMEAMRDRRSPVADAIGQKQAELARLRAAYNVTENEHQDVIDGIVRQEDVVVLLCNEGLESLVALVARHHALLDLPHDPDGGFASLLRAILHKQRTVLVQELLNRITTVQSREEKIALAQSLRSLEGDILDELLSAAARGVASPSGWEARMPSEVRSALEDKHASASVRGRSLLARRFSYRDVVERAVSASDALEHMVLHGDSCPAAIALAALAEENRPHARRLAARLLEAHGDRHWLLQETVETITGVRPAATPSPAGSRAGYTVFHSETVSRLVWFSSIPMFHRLDLEILADLARDAEVRWYGKDSELFRQGDPSEELYVLHEGTANSLQNAFGEEKMIGTIGPGHLIGELGVLTLSERATTVRVSSNHAVILVVSASRLHELMDQDTYVTKWMLLTVCERLQDAISTGQAAQSAPV